MSDATLPAAESASRHARNAYIVRSVLVFVLYTGCGYLSGLVVPNPITLYPAFAVGIAALFLAGLDLWPSVFAAALFLAVVRGGTPLTLAIMPAAQALQAYLGAYLLRFGGVDPLFRRSRNALWLFFTVALVSFIVPSVATAVATLNTLYFGAAPTFITWGTRYVATLFSLIVLTPFFLRWFAKPRFSRPWYEWVETLAMFLVLIIIAVLYFFVGIDSLGVISLAYFLLAPLFWIALRMRPRFSTLALVILSTLAVGGDAYVYGVRNETFAAHLFATEIILIAAAAMFLLIATLEEDRRLSANLLKSQITTLENALLRISSESGAKNDFIAVLAHELRNPLAPIASAIELMRIKGAGDDEDARLLAVMDDRMVVVKRLLDDLLDASRISEGKLALKKEVVDLESIVRRAVLSTEHIYHERHQALALTFPRQRFQILGDPVRLEQIFSNLLTNASKYSPSGERIELSVTGDEERVLIRIKDHGIGIPPEAQEHIFQPFFQVNKDDTKKGLGIGLALVSGFIDMHGGTIEVESGGRDQGSEFTVNLPVTQMELEEVPVSELPRQGRRVSTGLRILVVDDNDAAAWGVGKLLELRGAKVDFAYDGAQAIEKTASFEPDIVLLDISLPDRDGYTVAKTLRSLGFTGRIIGLTGFSTIDARAKGEHAGFDEYLVKPAGLAELKSVIPEIA